MPSNGNGNGHRALPDSTTTGEALVTPPAPPEVPPFRASKRQWQYLWALEDALRGGAKIDNQALGTAIGMSRTQVHRWKKDPAFVAWLEGELQRATDALWLPVVRRAGELALKGSIQHMEFFARVRGASGFRPGDGPSAAIGAMNFNLVLGVPLPASQTAALAGAPGNGNGQ